MSPEDAPEYVTIHIARAMAELLEAEPLPFHGMIKAQRNDDGTWVLIFWEPVRDVSGRLGA